MKNTKTILVIIPLLFLFVNVGWGQTLYWRTDGVSGIWTGANWSSTGSPPYTSPWVSGSNVVFTASSTITFSSTTVGNVTVTDGITVNVTKSVSLSGASTHVYTIWTGSTLNWVDQNFSPDAGFGVTKSGDGVWNMGAQGNAFNTINNGFTLNAGTVIVSGNNCFGGPTSALTINGGTIQSSGNITFANNITVNGNFILSGGNITTFSGTIQLVAPTLTVTNSISGGSRVFSGIISGNPGSGINFSGTGTTSLTGEDSYSGLTTISAGTLQLNRIGGSTIPSTNSIAISGGDLQINKDQTISNFTMSSGSLTVGLNQKLTITGAYNVTGGTINNSGTIILNGGAVSFPGANVIVNNGTANTLTNLEINSSGDISLTAGFNVSGTLTLTNGKIITGANTLTLGIDFSFLGSLAGVSPSSYIVGNFERWITAANASSILFPVGTSTHFRLATISYTTAPSNGGRIKVIATDGANSFNSSYPIDGSDGEFDRYSEALWSFSIDDASGTYDLNLYASGISRVDPTNYTNLRIMNRTISFPDWAFVGTNVPTSNTPENPILQRTGIENFSLEIEFGIGGKALMEIYYPV